LADVLVPIPLTPTSGLAKYQRPVFGDGRLYVSDSSGGFYCLGSPVALPLQCTQPVDFGSVAIGSISTVTITFTALIPITRINGCTTRDLTFQCKNSSLPQGQLAKGATFAFPVVWNLTQAAINDQEGVSFGRVLPGVESTVLHLLTTNGVPQYSTDLPIGLTGTTVSQNPFLYISPKEVDFGGIVIGSAGQVSGVSASIIVSNLGQQPLLFQGFAWDDAKASNVFHNLTTTTEGSTMVGNGFTSDRFPHVEDALAPGTSISVPLTFKADAAGSWSSILNVFSNGGSSYILLVGVAAPLPIANIPISTLAGSWDFTEPLVMNFGNVLTGTTASKSIRICNSGGSALSITKSKPPTQPELTEQSPGVDLYEGQTIVVNTCALGPVQIPAAFQGPNRPAHTVSDVWTLNTDGEDSQGQPFGVHDIAISATITTPQIGVLLANGTARYQYLGCYFDGQGRNLATQLSYSEAQQAANENGQCQKDCSAAGFIFAGTEYKVQCW
jgi:iron transport multicopper oxidase